VPGLRLLLLLLWGQGARLRGLRVLVSRAVRGDLAPSGGLLPGSLGGFVPGLVFGGRGAAGRVSFGLVSFGLVVVVVVASVVLWHQVLEVLEGGADLPVLRHVTDEGLEEGVVLHRLGVADDSQVAPGTGHRHVYSPVLREEANLTYTQKRHE